MNTARHARPERRLALRAVTRPRIRRFQRLLGRERPINAETAVPETASPETPDQGSDPIAEPEPTSVTAPGEQLTSPGSAPDADPGSEPGAGSETEAEPQELKAATPAGPLAPVEESGAAEPEADAKVEKDAASEQAVDSEAPTKVEKAEPAADAKTEVVAAVPAEGAKTEVAAAPASEAKGGRGDSGRGVPRGLLVAVALILVAGATAGGLIAAGVLDEDEPEPVAAAPTPATPAPPEQGSEKEDVEEAAAELGFPSFATKNTTRIGGTDFATTAAGAALAVFPSAGGSEPPDAVAIVEDGDWQAGIAASVLMAEPVRAPLLVSDDAALPAPTEQALAAMAPQGSPATGGAAVFAVGDEAAAPDGLRATRVTGGDAATVAAGLARLRRELTREPPRHLVITTSEDGGIAMPAAAWAARSGDPVLFVTRTELPDPTREFLAKNENVPVYVLGPPTAISDAVVRRISRVSSQVVRVGGDDPVENAIEFARYVDGDFGWNINDPGHGFVVARADAPEDAAAAAPISASGTWGPLLLTEEAGSLPGALRGYLLDVKPGYRTDPTRALYNRIWVIGDEEAIDVSQQAALDDLAELTRIGAPPR